MRYLLGLFLLFLITSCQKEISIELGRPHTDTTAIPIDTDDKLYEKANPDNGGLLVRKTYYEASQNDSVYINYYYDDKSRLVEFNQHFASRKNPKEENLTFYVKITYSQDYVMNVKAVYREPGYEDTPFSVTQHQFNYLQTTKTYQSAIGTYITGGSEHKDSIVYSYDGSNRINMLHIYNNEDKASKQEYTFGVNDNVTALKYYSVSEQLQFYFSFQYDDKVNPENFGDLFLLFPANSFPFPPGYNNFIFAEDKEGGYRFDKRVFTYNAHDRPYSLTATDAFDGSVKKITYYYAP